MEKVTFEVREDSIRFWGGDEDSPNKPCTFLLLLLLASIAFNAIIVIAIFRSFLRSHVFNLLLASMCLSLILDAGFNLSMACVVRASWTELYRQMGRDSLNVFCQLNAASMQFPLLLQSFHLALLSAHRSSVLGLTGTKAPTSASKPSSFKFIKRLSFISWGEALLLMFPIAYGVTTSRHFLQRYSCSPAFVTDELASMGVAIVVAVVGYILPWAMTLQYWTMLLVRVIRERKRLQTLELVALQRAAARSSPLRGLGSPLGFSVPPWSQIWGPGDSAAGEGYRFFVLCGLLALSQAVLLLPHLVCLQVFQFSTSHILVHDHKPLFGNTTIHLPSNLKPIATPSYDGTFTWFRFLHPITVPILIFVIHHEIRRQSLALFSRCRGRSNSQLTPRMDSMSGYLLTLNSTRRKRRKSKYKRLADDKTPILFATSEGIYLRQQTANYGSQNLRASLARTWPNGQQFVCRLADHYGKQAASSVPKLMLSPQISRRYEQPLLELEEVEQKKKGGKSVRFSQRVSEIPLGESIVSSETNSECAPMVVRPAAELSTSDLRLQLPPARRESIPFTRFPVPPDDTKRQQKSIELSMTNSVGSSLNLSSSSLLLSLSQRMRDRDS